MRIISFFSFKGGVGRTALLSNLGAHWAARGRVVALMDLDLIAPGISYSPLLGPYLDQRAIGLGMSDLLAAYHDRKSEEDTFQFLPPSLLLREMELPPEVAENAAPGGRLLAIGAGSPDGSEAYAKADKTPAGGILRAIPPAEPIREPKAPDAESGDADASGIGSGDDDTPHAKPDDARILRTLAKHIRDDLAKWRTPPDVARNDPDNDPDNADDPAPDPGANRPIDYLLIDARTGFAELAELSLGYLADHMVLVSGLNEQNLQGLRLTLRALWEQQRVPLDEMPALVTVVFSPVPAGEDDAVLRALEDGQRALRENLRHTRAGPLESMPRTFRIHYTPLLALSDAPLLPARVDSLYGGEVRAIADHLAGEAIHGERFQEELAEIGRKPLRVVREFGSRSQIAAAPDPQGRPNPFTDLPAWHWPLGEGAADRDRRRRLGKLVGKRLAGGRTDPGILLNRLAWDISSDLAQKRQMLDSLSGLGKNRREELLKTLEAQRGWALSQWRETAHRQPLMGALVKTEREWATLVLGDKSIHSPAPHQRHPLPNLEPWPEYWLALARETCERGGEDPVVLVAVDEALRRAAPEERPKLAEWLMELIPWDADAPALIKELEARARGIAPEHAWLDYLAAYRLLKGPEKLPAKAKALLTPLLNSLPKDAAKCNDLGVLAQEFPAMAAQAEVALRKAIQFDPKDAPPWYNLGNLFAGHPDRHGEAEAAYRRAMELDPKFAAPWNGLGSLQRGWRRDCQKALETFRAGLERVGGDKGIQAYLHMNLGHTLQLLDRPARTELETALALFDEWKERPPVANANALWLALELEDMARTTDYLTPCREIAETGGNNHAALLVVTLAEGLHAAASPQPGAPPADDWVRRIADGPRDWDQYWDAIQAIYLLSGFRFDARALGRAAVKALLALPAAVTDEYPDSPKPDDWRARYLPFANGESDGAGDPRDRHLFCRDARR
uniref:TPR repeat n=1 Tax=Candidatus Kentrum sp. SD TaxID=2126332 RepID=A0A450YBJ6_9GAMM|nr:MAG: TPR repeat [Candidatus Kentron sp. SD]VFK43614.1 MAG: TPR repeat [Candidatus Kentron sp. SD]